MKDHSLQHIHISSLSELHKLLEFPKPRNPLCSILRFEAFPKLELDHKVKLSADFFQITFKKDCGNKMIYGQSVYDFDEGVLSFFAPKQVFIKEGELVPPHGFIILIHPDYLRGFPLEDKIRSYSFFEYAVTESLILSEDEEYFIENIFLQIEKELSRSIDIHSQDVIISNIDLLLTYANRFYTRQFITRKPEYTTLLSKFEKYLDSMMQDESLAEFGLPTVTGLAEKFNLTPKYFSDLIRQHTGSSTQQHIHNKLIGRAKEKLAGTTLSIGEIAYQLGFEHSQSFSKLFKSKTNVTPLAFRGRFN